MSTLRTLAIVAAVAVFALGVAALGFSGFIVYGFTQHMVSGVQAGEAYGAATYYAVIALALFVAGGVLVGVGRE